MRAFACLLLAAIAASCSHAPTSRQPPAQNAALDRAVVLAIARDAVRTNDTWFDRAEFEAPARQADGSWSVLVWRLPKVPGGQRLISIDEQGRVTAYYRGR